MSRHWIRRPARWKETVGAGLLAAGVAAVTFYLTRLVLAREPLPDPSGHRDGDARDDGSGSGESPRG